LFFRRTKKGHKEKKHSSKHSSEYGVVHSETKPEGAGPIKLKISRLKSPSLGSHHKSSSEQTFTVSSLTTNETPISKEDRPESKDKSNTEDPPHLPDVSRKDSSSSVRTSDYPEKHKSSKSEKHGHKHHHHHHHKSSKSDSNFRLKDAQLQLRAQSPLQQSATTCQSHSTNLNTQSVSHSDQGKTRDSSPFVRANTYNPVSSKSSQVSTATTSQSTTTTTAQNLLSSQYMTSSVDKQTQQLMQQQQQIMASYASNPLAHIPYPSSFPQTSLQGQVSYPGGVWDVGKADGRSSYQQSANLSGLSRPPTYNEALLTQQRVQNQLYQSLQSNLSLDRNAAASQQQQLLQQQLQNQQQLLQKQKQQEELRKKQQEELQKKQQELQKKQQLELQKQQKLELQKKHQELQKKQQLELQKKQQELQRKKQQELQKKQLQQELMRQQQQQELLKQREFQKQKQLHQPYLQHHTDFQQKSFMQAHQQAQIHPFAQHQSHEPFIPPPPSHTSQSYTPSHADMVDPNLVMQQQQPRPQAIPPKKKPVPPSTESLLPPTPQIPLPPSPKTTSIQLTHRPSTPKTKKLSSTPQAQAIPRSTTHSTPNYSNAPRVSTVFLFDRENIT